MGLKAEREQVVAKYGREFKCYGHPLKECAKVYSFPEIMDDANWLIDSIPEPCKTCLLRYYKHD
jgi:hypothetical protein